jgi:hypothetical protein
VAGKLGAACVGEGGGVGAPLKRKGGGGLRGVMVALG